MICNTKEGGGGEKRLELERDETTTEESVEDVWRGEGQKTRREGRGAGQCPGRGRLDTNGIMFNACFSKSAPHDHCCATEAHSCLLVNFNIDRFIIDTTTCLAFQRMYSINSIDQVAAWHATVTGAHINTTKHNTRPKDSL